MILTLKQIKMSDIVNFESTGLEGLEESKAQSIKAVFEPMVEMLEGFEEQYKLLISESLEGITGDLTKKAKRLRLDIRKVRTTTENARKKQKEQYLRAGKAIDGVSNILKWAVQEKEQKLEEIENHFEIQEAKRLEELQKQRVVILSEYVEDAEYRDLTKFADDEFQALVKMKKEAHEDRLAAEKKAEEERKAKEEAERKEQERLKKENERLRKEAQERERLAKIEQEEREKEEREQKAMRGTKKAKSRKNHYCDQCSKKAIKKGDAYYFEKKYYPDYENQFLATFIERTCLKCNDDMPKINYKLQQSKKRGDIRKKDCPDADFKYVWQGGFTGGVADGGDVKLECHKCNLRCLID